MSAYVTTGFDRGVDFALRAAISILEADEALTGRKHQAVKIALQRTLTKASSSELVDEGELELDRLAGVNMILHQALEDATKALETAALSGLGNEGPAKSARRVLDAFTKDAQEAKADS